MATPARFAAFSDVIVTELTAQKDISLVELAELLRSEHIASFGSCTIQCCLEHHGMTAPMVIDGPEHCPFGLYEAGSCAMLHHGYTVIMDNLPVHKGGKSAGQSRRPRQAGHSFTGIFAVHFFGVIPLSVIVDSGVICRGSDGSGWFCQS